MVTVYGVVALSFMMTMYALEGRGRRFVLAFAVGCALSSSYGFLSGAWPFGVVEVVWTAIALRRFSTIPDPKIHDRKACHGAHNDPPRLALRLGAFFG